VSLDRKRRIFRPTGPSWPSMPSRALVLASLVGLGALGVGGWLVLRPSEAPAQPPVIGQLTVDPAKVAVVDGGTLRLPEAVVRLDGIVPAARGETCHMGGAAVDCGVAAANLLASLIRDASRLECQVHGHDAAGRILATCRARDAGLNRALVQAGWARAADDRPGLRDAESQARSARLGIWGR